MYGLYHLWVRKGREIYEKFYLCGTMGCKNAGTLCPLLGWDREGRRICEKQGI
jgi:hypothetical protein